MKFSFLSTLVAGIAIAQVYASPVRVAIIDDNGNRQDIKNINEFKSLRYGHAAAPPDTIDFVRIQVTAIETPSGTGTGTRIRMFCKGMKARLRQKAAEVHSAFRQALGLPPVPAKPQPGFVHIMPFHGPPYPVSDISPPPSSPRPARPPYIYTHKAKHGECGRKKHNISSFLYRFHVAIRTLGPWEGRAVAFVLGCGIGVLLRMMWVLALVSYRMIRGGSNDSANEYTEIVFVEEEVDDEADVPAPPYTDEKKVVVVPPSPPPSVPGAETKEV